MDTARAIHQLQAGLHLPIRELSRLIGKSDSFVKDMLALAGETPTIQKKIESGEVPYTALRDANAFPAEHREEVRKKVLAGKIKRDALKPLNQAVRTQPDKAEELLGEDYSGGAVDSIAKIKQIAPNPLDRMGVDQETIRLAKRLSGLLHENFFSEAHPYLQENLQHSLKSLQRDIDSYLVTSPEHQTQYLEDRSEV